MSIFQNAQFEISVAQSQQLPPDTGAEIVFAGRSNAGKSSAINTLTRHNRLAYVSKTPGRTQLINFFRLRSGAALVDLPGYGYADVPERIRKQWETLLERYLKTRQSVVGMVLMMDCRHPLKPLDIQMIRWFLPRGKPIHVLLTKSDKLSRNEAAQTLMKVQQALLEYGEQVSVQLFSSLKKTGGDQVESIVGQWLAL